MATTPYFHWPPHSSAGGSGAPEIALVTPATAADTTALVSPELAVAARPRMRRNSSGSGKQQQQKPGGGAKKPPQRGLGVAELERLRCGGDPLRELGVMGGGDASAPVHPLLHCNHHHHVPASAFDARYCSPQALVQPPPASPLPTAAPGCYVHHQAAPGCQRTPSLAAPEQQYFMDRWGRMGPGFSPAGNGAGGDHQAQLLPPEHPSSQSTIWRPATSSSSSCLQSGHRCDLCSRRMMRAFAERGAPPPPPPQPAAPPSHTAPGYSIYDLAAAMATARQGGGEAAFVVRGGDRKRGATACEAPAKKEVIREIEFFPPAASTHDDAGGLDGSEFVAPVSSSYGAAPPPLDLSLRL